MKRILTALGNSTLNNELKKYSKYDVIAEDLFYQEAVLDVTKTEDVDVIVISSLLQGQYDSIEFLKEVKKNNITTRIILIVDTISEEQKNILISKGIFDILYDNEIEISDVLEAIDREEPINIKKQIEKELLKKISEEDSCNKNMSGFVKEEKVKVEIQKQEVITIFGNPGAGKSTIIANLVRNFSKKTKSKILLIDLDTLNGNLEEILKVSKVPENVEILIDEDKKCGVNYVADLVLKNRFDTNVLDELVINCDSFDFLSGNTSLHYCQNVLNETCYSKLLKAAKEKYDFIFIDINSNIFLDSTKWALHEASRILFISEDSNIAIKKTTQLLEILFKIWNIWKNKVQIVINKSSNAIEEEIFERVCDVKVIGKIKQNMYEQAESYEKILETLKYIPKKTIFEKMNNTKNKITNLIKVKGDNIQNTVVSTMKEKIV
ncbi:MAG: ATP-binding cassette domain-containing protein [Clostridia bacterium]|nr:ATP-binding cassette domain-containing protein [Clostridia bacterium]